MGKIHSLETFGTVDGPGVRFVVFFQGCPMRCKYCHNPDTWDMSDGQEMTASEIIDRLVRNKEFYETGGITATGGEPMVQIDFLTELFSLAKENNIHTTLDTSGIMFREDEASMEKIEKLMAVTDLVMLDIKHIRKDGHRELTGQDNDNILAFAKYLERINKPIWFRHVVVPGITYDETLLKEVGDYIRTFSNVENVEFLPYHSLGKVKYDNMDMEYPMGDTPQLTKDELKKAQIYARIIEE